MTTRILKHDHSMTLQPAHKAINGNLVEHMNGGKADISMRKEAYSSIRHTRGSENVFEKVVDKSWK